MVKVASHTLDAADQTNSFLSSNTWIRTTRLNQLRTRNQTGNWTNFFGLRSESDSLSGSTLQSVPLGEFKALVKGDGGLIVYGPGRAVWPRCHATAGVRRSRLRSESHPPDAERPLSGTRSAQTLALSLSQ